MNDIFGIPLDTLSVVLVAALVICLGHLGWIAWRRPILFKLGVRNIPRRKTQTGLIVAGLMLSTLIISASLGTGDTLTWSMTSDVYNNLGEIDEIAVASATFDAPAIEISTKIDQSSLAIVDQALAGNPDVDGVMAYLEERLPVRNLTSAQAEPDIVVMGLDPSRLASMGGLESATGEGVDQAAFGPDSVVLSAEAAEALDASEGDVIRLGSGEHSRELTVSAIAENTFLSGYRRGREDYNEYAGLAVSLPVLQAMTGQTGLLSGVAISNAGGARDGEELTESVKGALIEPLAGTGLGVDPIKASTIEDGEAIADMFTTIFLVLGMFSVVSGLLLIVLIFSMLAAERRVEMGISRAIGTRGSQLTQQFIAEGAGYALIAGLIGATLGAVAAVGIAHALKWLFGQYVPIEPHLDPRSLVIAYSLGVLITVATIFVTSRRISRLNVVAAIRDIPEIGNGKRRWSTLLIGVTLAAAGTFAAMSGLEGDRASSFFMGASFAAFGAAMVARFIGLPGRLVFSLTGTIVLALWLTPERVGSKIWGDLEQGMEIFFLAGMFMVIGATMVIVQNLSLLLRGLSAVGWLFRAKLPAVRTAVAYPSASRGRTGLTIAMFSLIVFSVVLMGTMSENYNALYFGESANAGWDVRADVNNGKVIADFRAALDGRGVDTTDIRAFGTTTSPNRETVPVRMPGGDGWKQWPLYGVDAGFLNHSTLQFSALAAGYETDGAIVEALQSQPDLVIVDSAAIEQSGGLGRDPQAFEVRGLSSDEHGFTPVLIEVLGSDGQPHGVKVIGVISEDITTLNGIFAAQETVDRFFDGTARTSYYLALGDSAHAAPMAKTVEAAMIDDGVQGVAITDEMEDARKESSGFLKLIEGFMGLGLIVGLAAVGVISFRLVVERRQQIGMLRAIGYRRGMVSLSFGLETFFVVGIGIVAGTILGVGLGYNLFTSEAVGSSPGGFLVPWQVISVLVAGTLSIAALMTWIPARQASSVSPAEALRYE